MDPDIAALEEKLALWRQIQTEGREKLILSDGDLTLDKIHRIGAMDISFLPADPNLGFVTLTLSAFPSMIPYYQESRLMAIKEPYISGYLAFREAELCIHLYRSFLAASHTTGIAPPDILLLDGCGIYHERNYGLACHVGVILEIPTIGVAKTPIILPGLEDIQQQCDTFWSTHNVNIPMPIMGKNREFYGHAIRSQTSKKPNYVSAGHMISPQLAVDIIYITRNDPAFEPIKLSDKGGRLLCGCN